MRLIGWIFLLSGIWSIWTALVDKESLGMGGTLMLIIGLTLLTPGGRALAAWIGGGVLTGLCLAGALCFWPSAPWRSSPTGRSSPQG